MTIQEVLTSTGIPAVYSHFTETEKSPKAPPYLVYLGNGQDNFTADNTFYYSENRYRVEYYFIDKDETKEKAIEDAFLENGYLYEKSDDIYLEEEGVFVIYYYI